MGTVHVQLHASALLRLVVDHQDEATVLDCRPWDARGHFSATIASDRLPSDRYFGVAELYFAEDGVRFRREHDV